ncbi:MAG: PAS domain S-box protein [Candidatus Brocadiaceae bacterium]
MVGIRTKLIIFMNLLLIAISAMSSVYLLIHAKNQQKERLEEMGISLVMLLSQDNEVRHALKYTQPAFLGIPLKRIELLDREKQIGYWRISDGQTTLVGEKFPQTNIQIPVIPTNRDFKNTDVPIVNRVVADSGEVFYDFFMPIFEKLTFSEESLAAQVFGECSPEVKPRILGYAQIGLSTYRLNEKIKKIILYSIIPMGIGIVVGGIGIVLFLTKYLVFPLKRLADVTVDIASGNLDRTVDVYSRDEIGQLSMNFNKMTRALGKSYAELKGEIAERKCAEDLLHRWVRMEELVATISTNFINLAADEVDAGINRALQLIGEFTGIDRGYIFLFSEDKKTIRNTHEWCADGIEPQIENLKEVPVEYFPWPAEKLEKLETIYIPRVSELPEFANTEKEILQAHEIKSLVIVPMAYGGYPVGFLGLDSVWEEKTWIEQDITLFKMVGEIFSNALEHRHKVEMLRNARDQLEIRVKERTAELLMANKLLAEEIAEHKKARGELKKYEILISEIDDLPYICDTKGNILFVNHMFEKLTGHKREEFQGKPFAPLFDEENLKKGMDAYTRTLKGESPLYEVYFKDTGVLCEYKNLPLRDENGNIIGVIGTARDITERKRMMDELKQAKEYAENLIETANVMVIGLDTAGNVNVFNQTAEKITGYKKEEIIGKNCFDILTPRDKYPYIWDEFVKRRNIGQFNKPYENPIITKSGNTRYVSWQISDVRDRGKLIGGIAFGNDITDQKRMQVMAERVRLMSFVRDVSIAFGRDETLQDMLSHCAEAVVEHLDAAFARIWTLNEMENMLELQASAGMYTHINGIHSRVPVGKLKIGRIAFERQAYLTNSINDDPYISDSEWARREKIVSFAGYPLITSDRLVGVVAMFSRKPLNDFVIRALASASDIIAMGIDRKHAEQIRVTNLHYFESMNKISTVISQTMDISLMVKNVVDTIRTIFKCDHVFMSYPCAPAVRSMVLQFESEGDGSHISHNELAKFPEAMGDVREDIQVLLNSKEPLIFNITENVDNAYIEFLKGMLSVQSLMMIAVHPSIGNPWMLGLLQCDHVREWTDDEKRLCRDISYKVADALTNMLLYRDLQLSEDKQRTLLENLPQKVFYKDKNSVYVSCNENYAKDLKIKPDDIIGKTDFDFFPKVLAEKYRADDKRIMESGNTEDMEEKYIMDGRECIIHTIKTPMKDEKGGIIGILGVFWDVTEKIALQMEAVRTRHLASLGELAAGVAHEINNPITGVINCAQILSDGSSDGSKDKDIANRIIKEGKRIADIVNNLLCFSRPHGSKEKNNVSIHEILSDTLIMAETQLEKEGIKLRLNIPRTLPKVFVHHQQIQQVFLNLISNARYALNQKYTGNHENKILEISGKETIMDNSRYVKITFYDHGMGIPSNMIGKVMDPFFTMKPRGRGTGLGLSISHGIIVEHGGKITIDSVEGEFAQVSVTLPASKTL